MFERVEPYPGDPILTLNEDFQRDPRAAKVNLSIGVYFDAAGRLPVLAAVQAAEAELAARAGPRPYLPMLGAPDYRRLVRELVFGADHAMLRAGRIATVQTLGGSGALKIGAELLRRTFPAARVWVSDPTWDNHRAVFEGAGFEVGTYPYYDGQAGSLRFDAMRAAIEALPEGSIVLLHACCHNPTGVDLDHAQWEHLVPVLLARRLIAFVDMAYQGFGEGVEEDAWSVRRLADAGVPMVLAHSFSKNLSLYGERVGALEVLCASAAETQLVEGQLMATVRRNYSSPPTHGARLVEGVLADAARRRQWFAELDAMRARIVALRQTLRDGLEARLPGRDFSYFVKQRGMFSYTGLTPDQVQALRERHGVYLLRSGRMCVAGLNTGNAAVVAEAMAAVLGG